MDELFRFVALRPPAPNPDAIDLDNQSPLAESLAEVRGESDAREQSDELARLFAESEEFVRDASSLSIRLERLADALDDEKPLSTADLASLITASLGSSAASVAQSSEFSADLQRLQDSVLAFKFAPRENADPNAALRLLRAADLVQKVALGKDYGKVSTRRLVRMPESIFPLPTGPRRKEKASDETPTPSTKLTQRELLERAKTIGEALKALRLVRTLEPVAPIASGMERAAPPPVDRPYLASETAKLKVKISPPLSRRTGALMLNDQAISGLGPDVLRTLSQVGVDPDKTTLPAILHTLAKEMGKVERMIDWTTIPQLELGPLFGPYNPLTEPQQHDDASDPKPVNLVEPPLTHGQMKPAGIADLLVVLHHVIGYSPGEVAYVENVAQGEKFVRTTRRSELTEDMAVTIRETGREQERDVQATDRFDLRRESNEVIRTDTRAREPGSPGSESHGVLVETGASMEQAQQAAETFGRDVTTRAVGRVTERLRTETTRRRVQEFAEEVRHEFDNTTGTAREILVYQWLDRVVQAQVFSYGKRLFYDLVLPEPAALLLRALTRRLSPNGALIKPAPFTLEPSQINEVNYLYYTAGYEATGVEPPPDPKIVLSPEPFAKHAQDKYSEKPQQRRVQEVKNIFVKVPSGYRAVSASVHTMTPITGDEDPRFGITIGKHYQDLSSAAVFGAIIFLDGEVGFLPITLVSSEGDDFYTVNIEIWCEPTERGMDEWRQRTYDAILQASRQRMAEYEERAANLRASLRMEAINLTPERKRSTEREELQRSCLAVLTNQQFDGLSAIEHSAQGYPQPYLPNVEPLGRYVRFLQQAFEWEQMTWRYYPYFWGRKPYWFDKVLIDDNDTQFRDFLRAGSARVLLPVRPGFEGAVAHFMETGSVPTVEELGQIAGKLYLPFLAEGIGFDVATESAIPYGEPWKLRVPTTLVKLRSDESTPTWTGHLADSGRFVWADGDGDPL